MNNEKKGFWYDPVCLIRTLLGAVVIMGTTTISVCLYVFFDFKDTTRELIAENKMGIEKIIKESNKTNERIKSVEKDVEYLLKGVRWRNE